MIRSVLTFVAVICALAVALDARADSCVDLRTNTVYDCNGAPPAQKSAPPKQQTGTALRDNIREKISRMQDRSPQNSSSQTDRTAERIKSAGDRANKALTSGAMSSDPKERAQLRRDYQAAMKDLGKAYDDAAAASPDNRAEILAMKQDAEANFAANADQSGLLADLPAQGAPAAPPAADPNLFTACGPADRQGIRTCYELPPAGMFCRKTLQQNGDRVWTDDQATCDSADILAQRNAYFANLRQQQPKPQFGDDDIRKAEAFGQMSAQCQAQLNKMLEGADTGDKEQAYSAYGSLRAECDAEIKRLSREADASLPERKLSSRARLAMDRAMGSDPSRLVEAVDQRNAEAPYDIDEVIDFATSLLNLIGAFQGATVGGTSFGTVASGAAAVRNATTSRQGRGPSAPVYNAPAPVKRACPGGNANYVCSAR